MSWSESTEYSDAIDKEFVFELAKRGNVHVLSHQVTVESMSGIKFEGLQIPANCELEWAGASPARNEHHPIVKMTFRVSRQRMIETWSLER